jgi:hypothetical protein
MCCWAAGGGAAAVLSVQHCSWGVSNTPQSHILSGRAASHQKTPETVLTAAPGNPSWCLMSLPAHCLPAIACVPAQVRRGRSSGASSGLDLAHLNELDLWKHVADAMTLLANKANTSEQGAAACGCCCYSGRVWPGPLPRLALALLALPGFLLALVLLMPISPCPPS